jgi:hypothetical protein
MTDKFTIFEPLLPSSPWTNPWWSDGTYHPDLDTLAALLAVAAGSAQTTGMVAAAADMWAAYELRRAGFNPDEVWPRSAQPRVMTSELSALVASGVLPRALAAELQQRLPQLTRVAPSEARVLGGVYTKQADVLIASWPRGLELLISTKSMLSSYAKNLRNRFEEAYGDAKNLRARFPMAALGFLFLVGTDIPAGDLVFACDMLRKLQTEREVYDVSTLIVIDPTSPGSTSLDLGRVPDDLQVGRFLGQLCAAVTQRTPVDHHVHVRERRQLSSLPVEEGQLDAVEVSEGESPHV